MINVTDISFDYHTIFKRKNLKSLDRKKCETLIRKTQN